MNISLKATIISLTAHHLYFSVPQIEYPLGGSIKKGSHDYFLLIVAMVILVTSDCTIVTSGHLCQTIVQFDKTIVLPRNPATGSIHDYLFCNSPLFEVLRITELCNSTKIKLTYTSPLIIMIIKLLLWNVTQPK